MAKSSKPLSQVISNFLFQILLDSTLKFLDSVYIFLVLDDLSFSVGKCPYETRINIMESFENFNTQTTIVETFTVLFSDFLNNSLYELL